MQADEFAPGVERQLRVDMEVAGLVVAGERFLALGDVLDRTAELARGDAEQDEIRIQAVARAKAAADVPVHDAQLLALDPEHVGEVGAQMHRTAPACRVERELVAAGVVVGDRRARLHVDAGDAMGPGAEFCDMRSIAEGRIGRGMVAELGVDGDVGSVLVPDAMSGLLDRGNRVYDRRQRFIVDADGLGSVLGCIKRLGDDHGDDLADEVHALARHDEVLAVKPCRARSIDQRDVDAVAADSCRQVRQGRQVADVIRQQDSKHAAHCFCRAGVDRADAGMRMRRPQEHGVRDRPIQHDIVDVAAAPGGEADIFPPQHVVTDVDPAA